MFDRKVCQKKYYLKHKEEILEKRKKWYSEHKEYNTSEASKKAKQKYLETHKKEHQESVKKYIKTHRSKVNEINNRYRNKNKDKVKKWDKQYYIKTKNKGIFVWEQYYGEIPKNCCLIYKDGNKNNFNIDNLMLIERKDMLLMVGKDLRLDCGEEILKTGLIIAQLLRKKKKIEKGESV